MAGEGCRGGEDSLGTAVIDLAFTKERSRFHNGRF